MSNQLRYDGKVVVITGAGIGIGQQYALFFGSRGAKVVVNDIGASISGEGSSRSVADKVVEEIKKAGGIAVANYDSVEFGEKIIQTAIDNFGGVDVLINNAGILRDVSFLKMSVLDWEQVLKVHLFGTFSVTRAAWKYMKKNKFGRIINTGSTTGIYGNFGQANYGSAKSGIHGLTLNLAREGVTSNILVNTIAPQAASRMTETALPPSVLELLKPEFVVPLGTELTLQNKIKVGYLCHESCSENASLFEIGGGFISKLRLERSQGVFFDVNFTPEDVKARFNEVVSFEGKNDYPTVNVDTISKIVAHYEELEEKGLKPKL